MRLLLFFVATFCGLSACVVNVASDRATEADRIWLLPTQPPYPADNAPNPVRLELGKMLFFDLRLSGDGKSSCATCHVPTLGWSDGLPKAKGFHGQALARATPTMINLGYNTIQQWDGRKRTLEDQAMGPMEAKGVMNMNIPQLLTFLNANATYKKKFAEAYPGEKIDSASVSKAISAYERSIISNNSPFDSWLRGNSRAMTVEQVKGFRLFTDPAKGNCAACHQAPNFTDNGFHNLGLASWGDEKPDMGRFPFKKVPLMKGAFKTPTLREIDQTAPYFHDGSAKTLTDVIDHYVKGGVVKTNLSPSLKPLNLTQS
ncbi:MAG: cytochrome c peroxidase [Pseudomonadota bacterium]